MEKDTALMDLLAGWLEMVEDCREAADLPKEQFDREFFGDILPDTHEEWRAHYTDAYRDEVDMLYREAGRLVLGEEDEEPELSPAEFIRERILPLFEEDTRR